jgi:hypothetical protein
MDADSDQPPVCIESVEDLLTVATKHLSNNRFREALPAAELAQAYLVQLQSEAPRSFSRQMHAAKTIIGLGHFRLGEISESASFLVSSQITQDSLLPGTGFSNEEIAVITALSVIGSISCPRSLLVTTLTSFVDSTCRDFFDSSPFHQLRVLGSYVLECRFREALELLPLVLQEQLSRYPYLSGVAEHIKTNFLNKCLADFIRCFATVSFDSISSEFGIEDDDVTFRVSAMIRNNFYELSDRRIDMENRRTVRQETSETTLVNDILADINTMLDASELEKFHYNVVSRGLLLKGTKADP